MEMLLIWFGLSVVAGIIAANKGRSGIGFFLLACLLSPLVGILVALVVSEGDVHKCPSCAELIKTEAQVCKHCGHDVSVHT